VADSNSADAGSREGRRETTVVRDPEMIKVLAHPARLAILEHLSSHGGDITATEAAEVVGLSPSATSYHLRALAKFDLIKEAPSRGDGRERVYTAAHARRVDIIAEAFPPGSESAKLAEGLLDSILARGDERIRRWREHIRDNPQLDEASYIHETFLKVTVEELAEIFERIDAIIYPYRQSVRTDAPEQALSVALQLRGIPIT
jgi:DNA-binding transcriptional ArsR family regulator